jgi:tetratricopeptide (TPR) repeat protein
MKFNRLLILAFLSAGILLASCGSDNSSDPESGDTSKVVTPADLIQLNNDIESDPDNAALYHKRAKYYSDHKKIREGISDMNKALSLDSSKAGYYLTLSDLYFVANETGKAKNALEKSVKLDDKNTEAMLKLAELLLYVRKHDESITYLNNVLKLDKYNSKAYFMKGMNYKEMRDTAKAISSMQTAVEQDKQYYQAFMQLGILCAAKKDPIAVQYYKNAIRIEPKSTEAWYDMGKYYQDVKDWTNALGTYNSLLLIDQHSKNAHYNMGVIYLTGLKKYDLALEHFNRVIEIDPDYAEGYYARGITFQAMGNKKNAVIDLQSCLKIRQNYEPAVQALKELQ